MDDETKVKIQENKENEKQFINKLCNASGQTGLHYGSENLWSAQDHTNVYNT